MTPARPFYDILGVSSNASEAEIRRAFRLKALSVHPDKRPGDSEAAKNFHELRHVYDVLSNSERRARYDVTGDSEESCAAFNSAFQFFRDKYPKVSQSAIDDFTRTYPGSAAEDEDLCHFYSQRGGDVTRLLECVPLSTPEQVPRLIERIRQLIATERLPNLDAFQRTIAAVNRMAKQWKKRESREAAKSTAETAALVQAIQSRRAVASKDFLSDLEERYSSKKKRTK